MTNVSLHPESVAVKGKEDGLAKYTQVEVRASTADISLNHAESLLYAI
jgi:hypothetical protein